MRLAEIQGMIQGASTWVPLCQIADIAFENRK